MELMNAMKISAAGMKAQGLRLRVVSENVANADSVGKTQGEDPYRRKTVTFKNVFDRSMNADMVNVSKIGRDTSDFKLAYEPYHPLADGRGYIKRPNVNTMIELMDMREAQRSYEANLGIIDMSKSMIQRTVDLLRA